MPSEKQLMMSIVLLLFITVTFGHVTNDSLADKKSNWRQKMLDMDKIQVVRLEKKILKLLRMDDAPKLNNSRLVARWKRKIKDESEIGGRTAADESEKTLRKYEVEVLGNKRGQAKNAETGFCSQEFAFKAKLFPENESQTLLEKAYIDVPKNCSLDVVQFREFSPHLNKSSFFNLRRLEELAGQPERQSKRERFRWKTFDISSFLYPFWKVDGKNVQLKATLVCAKLCDLELPKDNDQIKPILKLSLREAMALRRDPTKRHVLNKESTTQRRRQKSPGGGGGAPNCDDMWDQDFFREVPPGLYNDMVGGGCCQRHFEVDFARIGWDNWVVSPPSIRSSYCLGRCQSYGLDVERSSDDTSLYNEIMNLHSEVRQARPCCSPTKFDSVVITVLRDDDQLMTQTLSDIIVDRCDCI